MQCCVFGVITTVFPFGKSSAIASPGFREAISSLAMSLQGAATETFGSEGRELLVSYEPHPSEEGGASLARIIRPPRGLYEGSQSGGHVVDVGLRRGVEELLRRLVEDRLRGLSPQVLWALETCSSQVVEREDGHRRGYPHSKPQGWGQ